VSSQLLLVEHPINGKKQVRTHLLFRQKSSYIVALVLCVFNQPLLWGGGIFVPSGRISIEEDNTGVLWCQPVQAMLWGRFGVVFSPSVLRPCRYQPLRRCVKLSHVSWRYGHNKVCFRGRIPPPLPKTQHRFPLLFAHCPLT